MSAITKLISLIPSISTVPIGGSYFVTVNVSQGETVVLGTDQAGATHRITDDEIVKFNVTSTKPTVAQAPPGEIIFWSSDPTEVLTAGLGSTTSISIVKGGAPTSTTYGLDEQGNTVSCSVAATVVPPPPPPPPPAGTVAAQFSRIDYSGAATAADAKVHGYRSEVLEYRSNVATTVAAIKAAVPGIKLFMYVAFVVNTSDSGGWAHALASDFKTDPVWGTLNHSWFVIDPTTNAPLTNSGYIFLDITQPTLQAAILTHVSSQAKLGGFDGIFWDGVDTVLGLGALKPKPTSPTAWVQTNTNYVAGMTNFLAAMQTGLHAKGLLHIANIGGAYQNTAQAALWQRWSLLTDGALEESWAYAGDTVHTPLTPIQVVQQLKNIQWSETNNKLSIVNCLKTDLASSTYAFYVMLLVSNGLTGFNVSNGQYGSGLVVWPAAYNAGINLGPAKAPAVPQLNGLWIRAFTNGTLTVNPTNALIQGYPAYSGTIS